MNEDERVEEENYNPFHGIPWVFALLTLYVVLAVTIKEPNNFAKVLKWLTLGWSGWLLLPPILLIVKKATERFYKIAMAARNKWRRQIDWVLRKGEMLTYQISFGLVTASIVLTFWLNWKTGSVGTGLQPRIFLALAAIWVIIVVAETIRIKKRANLSFYWGMFMPERTQRRVEYLRKKNSEKHSGQLNPDGDDNSVGEVAGVDEKDGDVTTCGHLCGGNSPGCGYVIEPHAETSDKLDAG